MYSNIPSSNKAYDKENYRLLMQWWGTEGRRGIIRDDYWLNKVDEWANKSDAQIILVPDVRFVNEAEFIKNKGGYLILISRTGFGGATHSSECEINDYNKWDYKVDNDAGVYKIKHEAELISELIYKKISKPLIVDIRECNKY
jgi:hypothetical protein